MPRHRRYRLQKMIHTTAALSLAALLAMVLAIIGPMAVAPAADSLYITENGAGRVVSVPISGGTPAPVATGLTGPAGVAVTGNTLYIAEAFAGRVAAVATSGGTPYTCGHRPERSARARCFG